MNNEEKKAIEILEDLLKQRNESKIQIKTYDLFGTIETVLNLIRKQAKEIEDKKEEIYAIAKANYILGQTDERSQWYKKINEKIKILEKLQKEFPNNEEIRIKIIALKELIGKEE